MKAAREKEWELASGGEVRNIAVVGDGGWGKRSLGHSYNSQTGNSFILDNITL